MIAYGSSAKVVISFNRTLPSLQNWLSTGEKMPIERGTPALEKALQEAKTLFQISARKDAKKVLVVIADKSPIGDQQTVWKEARDLEYDDVKVVPVAIGDEIDPKEIAGVSPYRDVLVEVPKDVDPKDLAGLVMDKVFIGTVVLLISLLG